MSVVWIVVAVLVIFFVWAAWTLRGRTGTGPDARTDRQRRTGGYDGNNG